MFGIYILHLVKIICSSQKDDSFIRSEGREIRKVSKNHYFIKNISTGDLVVLDFKGRYKLWRKNKNSDRVNL